MSTSLTEPPTAANRRNPHLTEFQKADIQRLTLRGHSGADIANRLGISGRTVTRYRTRYGINLPVSEPSRFTDEQRSRALTLLEDGVPYFEVARTINIRSGRLRKLLPGYEANDKGLHSIIAFMRRHDYL